MNSSAVSRGQRSCDVEFTTSSGVGAPNGFVRSHAGAFASAGEASTEIETGGTQVSNAEAPQTTGAASSAKPLPADVFVVFGITGDLAKVTTIHSLYRLEQRGLLDCPIVGVAADDWNPLGPDVNGPLDALWFLEQMSRHKAYHLGQLWYILQDHASRQEM